jgi:hypothetical protein
MPNVNTSLTQNSVVSQRPPSFLRNETGLPSYRPGLSQGLTQNSVTDTPNDSPDETSTVTVEGGGDRQQTLVNTGESHTLARDDVPGLAKKMAGVTGLEPAANAMPAWLKSIHRPKDCPKNLSLLVILCLRLTLNHRVQTATLSRSRGRQQLTVLQIF